jgi:hypothetical protein
MSKGARKMVISTGMRRKKCEETQKLIKRHDIRTMQTSYGRTTARYWKQAVPVP